MTSMDTVFIPVALNTILTNGAFISVIRYPNDSLFVDVVGNGKVGSGVVSLVIDEIIAGQILNPPIEITMEITGNITNTTTFTCAYYDFTALTWKIDGCSISDSGNSQQKICSCSHLTNFAVLLDHIGPSTLGSSTLSTSTALRIAVLIGCAISVALMGILILALILVKVKLGIFVKIPYDYIIIIGASWPRQDSRHQYMFMSYSRGGCLYDICPWNVIATHMPHRCIDFAVFFAVHLDGESSQLWSLNRLLKHSFLL